MEKLLVRDAGDGVEGSRVHEIVDKGKRPTSNVQRPTPNEENDEVIFSFSLSFGRSRRKFESALHFPRGSEPCFFGKQFGFFNQAKPSPRFLQLFQANFQFVNEVLT